MMQLKIPFLIVFVLLLFSFKTPGQDNGLIRKDGKHLFPLGIYDMPKQDEKLKELADAGFNLIKCTSKEALDRAHSVGLMGWMPLNFKDGATDQFKKLVSSVADHPALAVWEGPDEVVWGFTSERGLYRDLKVHEKRGAWWEQTPGAVKYAKDRSALVIPNMIDAISYIRRVDPDNRQVWINEACRSDAGYIRQYLDHIDITGCDIYPIRSLRDSGQTVRNSVDEISFYTDRFVQIGRNKPVYMVLQAFSWPELGGLYTHRVPAYPSFAESRYMAYVSIAHGAKGINYWGMRFTKPDEFIRSIYAVVSELAALQPFLTAPEQEDVRVRVIKSTYADPDVSVSCIMRHFGRDWMIIVINESNLYQTGVVIENLKQLGGLKLVELYGNEELTVSDEDIFLRMKPREVKVFATSKKWETKRVKGRSYEGF